MRNHKDILSNLSYENILKFPFYITNSIGTGERKRIGSIALPQLRKSWLQCRQGAPSCKAFASPEKIGVLTTSASPSSLTAKSRHDPKRSPKLMPPKIATSAEDNFLRVAFSRLCFVVSTKTKQVSRIPWNLPSSCCNKASSRCSLLLKVSSFAWVGICGCSRKNLNEPACRLVACGHKDTSKGCQAP